MLSPNLLTPKIQSMQEAGYKMQVVNVRYARLFAKPVLERSEGLDLNLVSLLPFRSQIIRIFKPKYQTVFETIPQNLIDIFYDTGYDN